MLSSQTLNHVMFMLKVNVFRYVTRISAFLECKAFYSYQLSETSSIDRSSHLPFSFLPSKRSLYLSYLIVHDNTQMTV